MNYIFKPKLFVTLKNYDSRQLYKDLMAGLIVGILLFHSLVHLE